MILTTTAFAEVQTVPKVDPVRFMGIWYVISANPSESKPANCRCGREVLAIRHDGKVNVHFSCNTENSSAALYESRSIASPLDITNSKFSVLPSPPQTPGSSPAPEDFWVIGLDENYRDCVVTDRNGNSLFILSKTASLDPKLYAQAIETADEQVDTSRLVMDSQDDCTYPAP